MTKREIQKRLNSVIFESHIHAQEYQDKFFFTQRIINALPEIEPQIIFEVIEHCNSLVNHPPKKRDYLNLLSNYLSLEIDTITFRERISGFINNKSI